MRTALARYLQRTRGVSCQPADILILSGHPRHFRAEQAPSFPQR
ncbi:MAG: hypothetical protein ACJ8AG_21340 [Ktedonobacteraceae bacterium]